VGRAATEALQALLKEGKPSSLTPERVAALEEAGFVWAVRRGRSRELKEAAAGEPKKLDKTAFGRSPPLKFNECLERLREFKRDHGVRR